MNENIICERPGILKHGRTQIPTPLPGESLLKIKRVGICGTDLHAYEGNQAFFTYPRILGHELAAEIVEINGDTFEFQIGEKVVILPYINCEKCAACNAGKTNCCENIQVFGIHQDGGMQQYVTFPTRLLLDSEGLSFDEIALVEPLAIAAHAIRRSQITKNDTVVIVGCGPIGIGIIKQLEQIGAVVIAIDTNPNRLNFCKTNLGVQNTINGLENPLEKIKEITGNQLASVVIDATGNKKAIESGHQYMSHGGKYVLVGFYKGDLNFHHPSIHAKETTLLCSRNATMEDFVKVIEMLKLKIFPTSDYITHRVSYTDISSQFESWLHPESRVVKVMTEW